MQQLSTHYDPILVTLSFAVAIVASYAALTTINRLREGGTRRWLWLGAVTFGLGVWAMHFTAMTALQLGMIVGYDPFLTALSVVFAIVGAAISFQLVSKPQVSALQVVLSGTALGAGIGVMHYVGMFAMRMDAKLDFELPMVGISVLVAVAIGTVGIWLLTTPLTRNLPGRYLIAAAVTGSAIPFMHYVAMAAARFSANGTATGHIGAYGGLLSVNLVLVLAVVLVSLPMFLTALISTGSEEAGETGQGA